MIFSDLFQESHYSPLGDFTEGICDTPLYVLPDFPTVPYQFGYTRQLRGLDFSSTFSNCRHYRVLHIIHCKNINGRRAKMLGRAPIARSETPPMMSLSNHRLACVYTFFRFQRPLRK
jgi:hypothetical protein